MANINELMAKLLKKEVKATYKGKEIILKATTFMDDLVIGAIMSEFDARCKQVGAMSEEVSRSMRIYTAVAATLHCAMHNPDGTKVFADIACVGKAMQPGDKELTDLFVLYSKEFELAKEEKKS